MISPTGSNQIRTDPLGSGHYGAARGGRMHRGVDYVCVPGGHVYAPISGKIVRHAAPYEDHDYGGILIRGAQCDVKMFYFQPSVAPGTFVNMGDVIGVAQDISELWGDAMKPHIHLEIDSVDPDIFISMLV